MPSRSPRLEILGEIGSGATSRVLRARLLEPLGELPAGGEVALKRLRPELAQDETARRALRAEAEAAAAVRHPGLVHLLAQGEDGGSPFVLLPFVPGRTLGEVLERDGPLPEPLLRSAARQVAGALAALHAHGFVHNDVKPENVRLDERGRAVLVDLGFARRAEPGSDGAAGDANPGSLAYLAPERARGGSGDEKGDVFALGVALYLLATGRHPFLAGRERDGEADGPGGGGPGGGTAPADGESLLAALSDARYVPPSRWAPRVSPFLDHLLADLLARDPSARPAAVEVEGRLAEGESGAWWRTRLDRPEEPGSGPLSLAARHLTPLVGREREFERLLELWRETAGAPQASSAGGLRAVWLLGQEGSGKSRLMSEFAAHVRAQSEHPLYLYGRCSDLERERPCAPLLRCLERWLSLSPGAAPGERERAMLAHLLPPSAAQTLYESMARGLEGAPPAAVPVALAAWLLALGSRGPLVLFLDDLNWSDEGTLHVLADAAERSRGSRALWVLGLREHEDVQRPAALEVLRWALDERARAVDLHLAPLDEEAVLALVGRLFHRSAPQRRIAQVLWSRSRGNPGFLAEILAGLIERGQAAPHHGGEEGLVLSIEPDRLPLPRSLRDLIQERFEDLAPLERRWLQRLSVVGGRIHAGFLLRAFPKTRPAELDRLLARLAHTGWLVPAGDRFRFARPALREAVYRTMDGKSRVRYHAQAARALAPVASAAGAREDRFTLDDAFQRAFHLRAAGEHGALLQLLAPLLKSVLRRGQPQRVHTLARWGLEALDAARGRRRDRERLVFLEAAADAADRLGYRAEQRQWLDALSDLDLSRERDADVLARVYLLHGRYAVSTGQYGLARGMLRNAVQLAEERSLSGELHSEALRRLAAVQTHVGALGEARDLAERALELSTHDPQRAVGLLALAVIQLLEDEFEEALASVDRALKLLRATREWQLPGAWALAHLVRGRIYRVAGLPQRALAAMSRAVRLARQAGERRLETEAMARLGGLLLDLDRPQEAEARLREALLVAREIEDRRGQALAGLWLGILLWEGGAPEAERELERVERLTGETGLFRAEALTRAILARIARERGERERALAESGLGLELLAQNGGELADRIVITGTRALVLHGAGRRGEAAGLVRDLRGRMRRETRRFSDAALRRAHRTASTRLLASVLAPAGVIYPRVRVA